MMIKLNKNQRRFFEEAVDHFGDQANDVRFKLLAEFASENGLILPTSALKKYCQEEGQVRGHYNLLLTGVEPPPKEGVEDETDKKREDVIMPEFKSSDIILDTPAFADDPSNKKSTRFIPKKGEKPIHFINPVYVVLNSNDTPIAVCTDPKSAYEHRVLSLHDQGTKGFNEVSDELKYRGISRIGSNNSQLWCEIVAMELK